MTLDATIALHRELLRACSVEGCTKPLDTRGWCHAHYEYWRRHGTLYVPPTPAERFWRFVDKSGDCWVWTGTTVPPWGYGSFSVDGAKRGAHRFSYELHRGPIPDGLEVDHLCFNPPCVNPAHLEAVSPRVNSVRAKARVTHCPKGHAYDGPNLLTKPTAHGGIARQCRECAYAHVRRWKRRRREAARAA